MLVDTPFQEAEAIASYSDTFTNTGSVFADFSLDFLLFGGSAVVQDNRDPGQTEAIQQLSSITWLVNDAVVWEFVFGIESFGIGSLTPIVQSTGSGSFPTPVCDAFGSTDTLECVTDAFASELDLGSFAPGESFDLEVRARSYSILPSSTVDCRDDFCQNILRASTTLGDPGQPFQISVTSTPGAPPNDIPLPSALFFLAFGLASGGYITGRLRRRG